MPIRDRSRRSFLAAVLGGAMLFTSGSVAAADDSKFCGRRRRRRRTGITDRDSGPGADPANFGRGTAGGGEPRRKMMQGGAGRPTGGTDRDSGANADPINHGRHRRRLPSSITDYDQGAYADAPCS